MEDKIEYILCAAIHFKDGKEYLHQPKNITSGYVVCGRRHHNCFMTRRIIEGRPETEPPVHIENVQGFVTSYDRFLNRQEAYKLAVDNGQIEDSGITKTLLSEDLY